jgi:hypothetical protein
MSIETISKNHLLVDVRGRKFDVERRAKQWLIYAVEGFARKLVAAEWSQEEALRAVAEFG